MSSYQQSKKEAFYSMISQKVSQKMDSLPQIDCVSERWIWELIQNAKDAGSQFGKINIKIDIYDNKLHFSHNGNPFTMQNLDSLAFHYSAKDEENRDDVETTGKYGTGFMVTYVISKKVKLVCKFKDIPQAESELESQKQEEIQRHSSVKQECPTTKKELKTNKLKNKQSKVENKQVADNGYYQDLQITLDRSYGDVKQLKEKIIKLDKSIAKQLKTARKIDKYVRTVQSFDTNFIYQDLDNASFKHILSGILSLKRLFPLTLLFNSKLYSIQVYNHSKKLSNLNNFEIVRDNDSKNTPKFGVLSIFTAAIYDKIDTKMNQKEKDKLKTCEQYLYDEDRDIHSIIAFPIKVVNNKIHLNRLESNFPKIFKEFPLIGCEDTGFNFAFTSKELYPSENRKQLMLRQLEGRKGTKAEKNWEIINRIFDQAYDMYTLLIPRVERGKFNLFIIPEDNQFTNPIHESRKIKQKINKIRQNIFKSTIFFDKNNAKKSLKQFQIIYDITSPQLCQKTYALFEFLLKDTLSKEDYKQFCQIAKIQTVYFQLNKCVNNSFISIDKCVTILSQLGFDNLLKTFKDQNEALSHLLKIYQFIIKQKNALLYTRTIVLTQKMKFKCFSYNQISSNLQIQVDFKNKSEFFQMADRLGINYSQNLIHKKYNHLFENQIKEAEVSKFKDQASYDEQQNRVKILLSMAFQAHDMMNKISDHFNYLKRIPLKPGSFETSLQPDHLIKLGMYLSSFNSKEIPEIKMANSLKVLRGANQSLCNQLIRVKEKNALEINQNLQQLFRSDFFTRLNFTYKNSKTVTQFANSFINNDKQTALQFIRYLLNSPSSYIEFIPNADEEIIRDPLKTQLKQLKEGYQILNNQDIQIYDKLYQKCNNEFRTQLKPLRKSLVHPSVITSQKAHFTTVSFEDLFVSIKNYYNLNTAPLQDKQAILNYTFHIYEEHLLKNNKPYKCKFDAFKDIINSRHLEFGKLLNFLSNKNKDFICKIFKMKDQFEELDELISNYSIEETLATMRRVNQ